MSLLRRGTTLDGYQGLTAYAGDLHNHCGISYGHGSVEDAFRNARLQLDFATVTGHASWHDMPDDPPHVAAYHERGFERLRKSWEHVQDVTESVHEDGSFVSFLSFEWHSMTYGDHCVYYRSGRGPLAPARASGLEELRATLRGLGERGLPSIMLPHHIGYRRGSRGINWSTYTAELSPVIELLSMHGCGEDDRSPRPYLHTMGPRDAGSTALTGLAAGHRFGFIGSTDHHSGHPGSYGYGRAMVWAEELTREALWEAITSRRTYCVTGDRIMLATSLDGRPMGSTVAAPGSRSLDVAVQGGSAVDYVEVVRNGEVIARERPGGGHGHAFSGVVPLGFGWGEVGVPVTWDVELEVVGGRIDAVEPRLRGYDVVAPSDHEPESFSFSHWSRPERDRVVLHTRTDGNPTVMTDATQRFALHVTGDTSTKVVARVNGLEVAHSVGELLEGPRVGFLGGFVSGAYVFDRAEPRAALDLEWSVEDTGSGAEEDWYYVRVRQYNDQYAWSSPIWATRAGTKG
ncbi:DUF3604 domain-containing protein [Streptomyces filamentosus]